MPIVRGFACACALLLAAMLLAFSAGAASAEPSLDIYADWADNGVIDGHYSFADLQGALDAAQGDVRYAGFADAVSDALDAAYLGTTDQGTGSPAAAPGPQEDAQSALPEPRSPDESGDPPWPFLALTVLAGALVVTGAGSSIYRRARR